MTDNNWRIANSIFKKIGRGFCSLSFWLAIGTWILAIIGYCSLQDNRKNFIAEQRPLIWLDEEKAKTDGIPHRLPDGRIKWNVYLTNYGKSTAVKVVLSVNMKVGNGPPIQVIHNEGLPILPGTVEYGTAISPVTRTQKQFDALKKTDEAIAIGIFVTYEDTSGTPYSTGICEAFLATGAVAKCDGTYVK